MGIRRSSMLEARRIAAPWIRSGVQTIVFCRSRLQVEVMLSYLRQDLAPRLDANRRVRGYRAGYLPLHRREIEAGLRTGEITGVVSTIVTEELDRCGTGSSRPSSLPWNEDERLRPWMQPPR